MPSVRCSIFVGVCCCLFLILFYNAVSQETPSTSSSETEIIKEELYDDWKKCVLSKLEPMRGDPARLWTEFHLLVSQCDKPYADILRIKDFANQGETKHHILPLVNTPNNTIITLGIGLDIEAEEKLQQALGKENAQFYGADPIVEMNRELYSKIGKFFPMAVGARAGYSEASVMKDYKFQQSSVVHVDAVYFLTKMVGLKFIDQILIDAEYAEYEMFPMFLKGGVFDQADVTVCQFNVEMHKPDDAQKKLIHDFIFQILEEERYAFFFPVNVSHLRLFFINFNDTACVNKYIPKTLTVQSA